MGMPWAYGPKRFDVQAGESSLIQLNVPYRGELKSLRLAAEGGTTGTFEIYNSEAAARAAVAEGNGSSESAADGIPFQSYMIHSGALEDGAVNDNAAGVMYVNRDGTPSDGDRRLWMHLHPEGDGILSFILSMVIDGVQM